MTPPVNEDGPGGFVAEAQIGGHSATRPTKGAATAADVATMARQANLAILNRLTSEVLDAVADGDSAVPEASRLALWLRVDLLPWAESRIVEAPDEHGRAALRSDCGVLSGLDSLLTGSSGIESARWTRQIHRTATILLARMEYLED